MPKVSVVVPVYNVEKYIRRCLESILHQTFSDLEIVLVNDCTPDNSMEIVEDIINENPSIIIINHRTNKGLMWARRSGYMAATGDYITFCDSDDFLPNNAIELLFNKAKKTNADIVSGRICYEKVNGITAKWNNSMNYGIDRKSIMKSVLLGELPHNLCGKLFRRSLLQDYNYQTFCHFINGEDGCLFYQIIQNTNKLEIEDSITYNYMENKESSTKVRINDNGIRCICYFCRIKHDMASIYPDLKFERHRNITKDLYELYSYGYCFDTNLRSYIEEQGLMDYNSLGTGYFTIKERFKFWLKCNFQGPLRYLKSKFV